MSSRASRRNDTNDVIKKIQNDNRRDRGLARQAYSGLASAEYGSSTANSGGSSTTTGGGTGSSGVGLGDTNVWTGINSFSSSTSFTVTSPQIYLGDEAGDTINITGQVNLNGDIDMNTNDITSLGDIGFDVIGGQITADTGATGMNFVTTSDVPFRFTPNATNVVDITDAGIDMIAGDIDLNNLNIIGVNAINFNTTGQQITDNANGLRFVMTSSTDTFDITIDGNETVSFEKFFMDLTNTRIQMTEEVAPSAPIATQHYIYVDSTSNELSILHSSGSAVSLESSGGGVGLGDTNTWTGINTFTSTTSFSVTSPNIYLGDASTDKIYLTGNVATDISLTAGERVRAYSSSEIGFFVSNYSGSTGTEGSVQIPWLSGFSGTGGASDTDFGAAEGCIGIWESSGVPWLAIRNSLGHWYIPGITPARLY